MELEFAPRSGMPETCCPKTYCPEDLAPKAVALVFASRPLRHFWIG